MSDRAAALARLQQWRAARWITPLDLAFARFIHDTDLQAPGSLLVAVALTTHVEGQGHSCLDLWALKSDPLAVLGWPEEAGPSLREFLESWPADGDHESHLVESLSRDWHGAQAVELNPPDTALTGATPLVLRHGRLFLRRYWRYEARVAAQVQARSAGLGALPSSDTSAPDQPDPARVRGVLASLFHNPADGIVDWQQVACALALRGRITLITGGPGTGKTHTGARLLVLLQALHCGPEPLRVALAAPTGKAAARLRQSITKALQGLDPDVGRDLGVPAWASGIGPARTLHALLGAQSGTRRLRHHAANPLDVDVLMVDEASMVNLELMDALLDALPAQARLVLMGDKDQLASVEAGAVMGDFCATVEGGRGHYSTQTAQWIRALTGMDVDASPRAAAHGLSQQTVVLHKSHRFSGPIGRLAEAVNEGQAQSVLALCNSTSWAGHGPDVQLPMPTPEVACVVSPRSDAVVEVALGGRPGAPGGYRRYLEWLVQRPAGDDPLAFEAWALELLRRFDAFRVLCAVREGSWGVIGLNAAIEEALVKAGWLGREVEPRNAGPLRLGPWYEGRPVMVTRNAPSLGIFNGDVGLVLRGPAQPGDPRLYRAYFLDGEGVRSVSVSRLTDVETAFAMTVHKSQGSEFEHVALALPEVDGPVLTREWLYTGITRAREALTLITRDPGLMRQATQRVTRRMGGLRQRLDVPA